MPNKFNVVQLFQNFRREKSKGYHNNVNGQSHKVYNLFFDQQFLKLSFSLFLIPLGNTGCCWLFYVLKSGL